jgi:thimet oligopeptidase
LRAACAAGIDGAQIRVKLLEATSPGAEWVRAWDVLNAWIEDAENPLVFLKNVAPDAEVRAASEACELRWQSFHSQFEQDEAVYRGALQSQSTDAVDGEVVRRALEQFEDAGVALPPDRRSQAKALVVRIGALGQQFDKNIRDANVKVTFSVEELQGVPDRVWKEVPRNPAGRVLLGIGDQTYMPVMQFARSSSARERMWRAKTNEGGEENLRLFAEIGQLRREYARLFGFKSYDEFMLRRRMAGSLSQAKAFLDDVSAAVREGEAKDMRELCEAKSRTEGTPPAATVLNRWDVLYYTELVKREKYAIDEESLRPYFPPQESLRFVMRIAETMFGVRYVPMAGTWWQPDVQAYSVVDVQTNAPIASLYVDLYPRAGKFAYASVWSLRNSSSAAHRLPMAALVVNFDRKGLTLSDLETLLHEFGHSLHNNLSATRWSSDGGTRVKRDFVEAPSLMLQEWVYDPQVMRLFKDVCATCRPVPEALLVKARVARDYGKGIRWSRQHLFAAFDLAVYGPDAPDPLSAWTRLEGATLLGHVDGTFYPAGFRHIASGGYAVGYYGYLWSLALAMDLKTGFDGNLLDPRAGARYRQLVMGRGGEKAPADLVRDFLGRDFRTGPFFVYMRQ